MQPTYLVSSNIKRLLKIFLHVHLRVCVCRPTCYKYVSFTVHLQSMYNYLYKYNIIIHTHIEPAQYLLWIRTYCHLHLIIIYLRSNQYSDQGFNWVTDNVIKIDYCICVQYLLYLIFLPIITALYIIHTYCTYIRTCTCGSLSLSLIGMYTIGVLKQIDPTSVPNLVNKMSSLFRRLTRSAPQNANKLRWVSPETHICNYEIGEVRYDTTTREFR